jgi:hypothetical protein
MIIIGWMLFIGGPGLSDLTDNRQHIVEAAVQRFCREDAQQEYGTTVFIAGELANEGAYQMFTSPEYSNLRRLAQPLTNLPIWCKAFFVVDIIWLAWAGTMFLNMPTVIRWQVDQIVNLGPEVGRDFAYELLERLNVELGPEAKQVAYLKALLSLFIVAIGIPANVFLLKVRRLGVILGTVILCLALLSIIIQFWQGLGILAIIRVIWNGYFLVSLMTVRELT